MNIVVLMPTANPPKAAITAEKWRLMGYRMAFFLDLGVKPWDEDAINVTGEWYGVWAATNKLARAALANGADVCLYAGDDMDPDPAHAAHEIAKQYLERFPDGYGLMQPCGDMQGMDGTGKPAAARICGSPWMGKAWIRESYLGNGPTNADYHFFYADEELARVAEKQGVMWWRSDLTQYHRHWSWGHCKRQDYHERNQKHWDVDQRLFMGRNGAGFPGAGRLNREEAGASL